MHMQRYQEWRSQEPSGAQGMLEMLVSISFMSTTFTLERFCVVLLPARRFMAIPPLVRNTVWVLGGKNQAGKRISVSLSRSSTAAMGCQWPVLECWLIIPMWEINISGNALVIKKPSVIETLGSTIVGHQKVIMFMSPVSGTCFSKVLLREPVMSCQTSSFNNSAIWGTFLDQFIRRIKIMALLLQTCTHQNPQSNVA